MGFLGGLVSSLLLFCLVFGMSATVEMKSLKKQVQNRVALSIGVLLQFVILPFVGFCVVKILNLPSTTGVILLVITSSPGGSYSNWWCSLFNAELALSVTMTTISTLLSVVMLPTNLVLYTRWTYSDDVVQSLDWTGLTVSLVVVISGIGSGLYSSYRAELRGNKTSFHKAANRLGNIAGILLVSLSIAISSTGNGESGEQKAKLWDQGAKFYIGVTLPPIIALVVAVKIASHYGLEKPERVAVAIEACYQNTGIATSVAMALYSGKDLSTAIGVPLFYGIVEAVLLTIFCVVCWKRGWTKAPSDENCCKVLYNTYESEDGETTATSDQGQDGNVEAGDAAGPAKHQVDVQVDLGSADDDENLTAQTEMTRQPRKPQGTVVVGESPEGNVSVVKVKKGLGVDQDERSLEEEGLPKYTRLERAMATVRARAAGYGFGQQDEERGLRTSRGPVTLGLSQVPTPEKKKGKKGKQSIKQKTSEEEQTDGKNIPAKDKTLD